MGIFSGSGKGKLTVGGSSSRAPPPSPSAAFPMRERLHIPVQQARWHWQYRQPLLYPDITLLHDWHLNPQRIPVSAVPGSRRAHAKEVRRRRELVTPEERRLHAYAPDSPEMEVWFALNHEQQRRRGVQAHHTIPPLPPIIKPEEAAYQATLAAAMQVSAEKTRCKDDDDEEDTYQARFAEALAPLVVGDCVILPSLSRRHALLAELHPAVPQLTKHYTLEGGLREWISLPTLWLGATPA